jgi:hypothetical protein
MTLEQQFQSDQKTLTKRELQKKYHPDKHPGQEEIYTELFKQIKSGSKKSFSKSKNCYSSHTTVDQDKELFNPFELHSSMNDGMNWAERYDLDYFYFETDNWHCNQYLEDCMIPYHYPRHLHLQSKSKNLIYL